MIVIGVQNIHKTCLPTLLALFTSVVVFSQGTPSEMVKYYHDNGTISSEGMLRNGKPDGYWKNYFENGSIKSEGTREEHLLHGEWKFYSPTGVLTEVINYRADERHGLSHKYSPEGWLMSTTEYVDGQKEGRHKTFFASGALRSETVFVSGREHGLAYEMDERGTIVGIKKYDMGRLLKQENINRTDSDGSKEGVWKEFYTDRKVKMEGSYRNNLQDGYWKSYDERGELVETLKYAMGQLVSDAEELSNLNVKEQYYTSGLGEGRLKFRGTYREGKEHGTHNWFGENGAVDSSVVYRNGVMVARGRLGTSGMRDGYWIDYYYPSGAKKSEGNYENGYRRGEWVFYYESGGVEAKGKYTGESKPDGQWRWFYENGVNMRDEVFTNGKENGWLSEYNDTGKVVVKGEYRNGKEEGEWLFEIGDHREVGTYEAGLKTGIWKHYYLSNNALRFEGEFFDDLEQGKHTWYFDSGEKMVEGKYVSGVKEGSWKRYAPDGTVLLDIEYRGGVEHKVDGQRLRFGAESTETIADP